MTKIKRTLRGIFIALLALLLLISSYSLVPTALRGRWWTRPYSAGEKVIYLTFDDGPDGEYTPQLLDLLGEYGVRATFFVVADFASEHPELIERMRADGDAVGLHSLSHHNALFQTPKGTRADFERSLEIASSLGIDSGLFRPPWGHFNLDTLAEIRRLGLRVYLWDVMAQDWLGDTTADIIAEKLLRRTGPGDVVCLHDGRGQNGAPARTIEALRRVIPQWQREGYTFGLLDGAGQYIH